MSSLKKFKLWFFVKIKLYNKKILKKDVSINMEVIKIWELFIKIFDRLFDGKNPPEEIIVIARFKELNILISKIFKTTKIANVIIEYKRKILKDCFNVSALLKDIKFVKVFLKL
tara:strand:+ start:625 stop:966 length:342 start_codon:yes stop_codon:yes gene_type:complete